MNSTIDSANAFLFVLLTYLYTYDDPLATSRSVARTMVQPTELRKCVHQCALYRAMEGQLFVYPETVEQILYDGYSLLMSH